MEKLILVLTCDDLSTGEDVKKFFSSGLASKSTLCHLLILVNCKELNSEFKHGKRVENWRKVHDFLIFVYAFMNDLAWNLHENPISPSIDILFTCLSGPLLLNDKLFHFGFMNYFYFDNSRECGGDDHIPAILNDSRFTRVYQSSIDHILEQNMMIPRSDIDAGRCQVSLHCQSYDSVVLGGTFDHLHAAHKILLTIASWICHGKITIGISDLLRSKSFPEYLEPFETRCQNVRNFLDLISNGLDVEIVAISDPYGPTITDQSFQAMVLSLETIKGGEKINEIRREKGWTQLDIFSIDLIPALKNGELKMSSTFIRKFLASLP